MSTEKYPVELVERMARRLFMESTESRSGWTWPINGEWGRERDMERAEKALDFVLGEWLAEHDREIADAAWEKGLNTGIGYAAVMHLDLPEPVNPYEVSS